MCNGSLALGSGCGVCSRCVEESGLTDAWIENAYAPPLSARDRAQIRKDVAALRNQMRLLAEQPDHAFNRPAGAKWGMGDLVAKKRGSQWRGKVVGFYTTDVTRIGYCVESFFEVGSVQVWPEEALVDWKPLAGVPEPTDEPSLFNVAAPERNSVVDDLLGSIKFAIEIITDSWGEDAMERGDCQAVNLLRSAVEKATAEKGA